MIFFGEFKEAKVVSITKPISLLSSISKILEKIIKSKITEFLDDNNILPPLQFGFRREHNTVHPFIHIRNMVKNFGNEK